MPPPVLMDMIFRIKITDYFADIFQRLSHRVFQRSSHRLFQKFISPGISEVISPIIPKILSHGLSHRLSHRLSHGLSHRVFQRLSPVISPYLTDSLEKDQILSRNQVLQHNRTRGSPQWRGQSPQERLQIEKLNKRITRSE